MINMKYTKREQRAMAEQYANSHKPLTKEDIKVGFRFYLRVDDCGGKLWFSK